jgi:hypothetical protein
VWHINLSPEPDSSNLGAGLPFGLLKCVLGGKEFHHCGGSVRELVGKQNGRPR